MTQIEITKPFRFAVGGIHVVDIKPGIYEVGAGTACTGERISMRCAEVAAEMGCRADPDAEPAEPAKPGKASKGGKAADKTDDLLSGAGDGKGGAAGAADQGGTAG